MTKLILASASPRRKQYLSYLGTDFEVIVPNVDESKIDAEKPSDLVLRLSKLKAQAVSLNHPQDIVIAADTVVAFEDTILGTPKDRADAFNMIKLLQGKDHFVYTGTTIIQGTKIKSFVKGTKVTFSKMDDELIRSYVATGECDDKAGSYALQGIASMYIEKVEGSVSTVVGLPINEVRIALEEFGIRPQA